VQVDRVRASHQRSSLHELADQFDDAARFIAEGNAASQVGPACGFAIPTNKAHSARSSAEAASVGAGD
jgi:hypothetical protein